MSAVSCKGYTMPQRSPASRGAEGERERRAGDGETQRYEWELGRHQSGRLKRTGGRL